jgi:hypothetical protein
MYFGCRGAGGRYVISKSHGGEAAKEPIPPKMGAGSADPRQIAVVALFLEEALAHVGPIFFDLIQHCVFRQEKAYPAEILAQRAAFARVDAVKK